MRCGLLALAAALLPGSSALGVPVEDLPIGLSYLNVEDAEYLGEGPQVTYLVVDFRAANGGSFAFGYRHDGQDTAQEMLAAAAADGILEIFLEEFSFGPAVRGVAYPREAQQDIFQGAFGGERSWILWEGDYGSERVQWSPAEIGINGVEFGNTVPTVFLPDGGFYGLVTSVEYPGSAPLLPLPGDFNSDGVVDGDDLLDAVLGFGIEQGPTLAAGDADRDGDVDRGDLVLWQESAGSQDPASAVTSSVPEPGGLLLALLACMSCGGPYGCAAVARSLRSRPSSF